MSLVALALAKDMRVGDSLAKLILILLADRHNADTGECTPSVATIADEAEVGLRTAHRKLKELQAMGLIEIEARHDDRRPLSNNYRLTFTPSPLPREDPKLKESLPPEDWRPKPETIAALRREFPHHDTNDDLIDYLVRDWIGWCHAKHRTYVRFEQAWVNNARSWLRRQSARPATFRDAPGHRRKTGSVFGAVRDLLDDAEGDMEAGHAARHGRR